jgi:hypothetical protein
MKNNHIIIESNLTKVVLLYYKKIHLLKKNSKEWSLKCYWIMIFNFFFVQMILNFQKEINVIMYIIEF